MTFTESRLKGAFVIDMAPRGDDRGFFGRAWCREAFAEHGLTSDFPQANISHSRRRGTIRGLHYQVAPSAEAKLIRCVRGAIWDVAVDLRAGSPTCFEWFGVELTAENRRQMYVPAGFAHGFQTLADDTEVFYPVADYYAPAYERGIRWNDPVIAIDWPQTSGVTVSPKDRQWPDVVREVS